MATSEATQFSASDEQQLKKRASLASNGQNFTGIEIGIDAKARQEDLNSLMAVIQAKEAQHQDDTDVMRQPSYSQFQVPYFIKCRNRYNARKKAYEQRFQYEMEQLVAQQATGYEAARLSRHLCITAIWPPLHSHSEIVHTQRYFFRLKRKERQRLNTIMSTNII